MTTYDHYAMPVADETWNVPMSGDARFTWEYDGGFDRLLNLYQKGKDKQWDQATRIDWSIEVDPYNVLNQPDEMIPIYGSRQWQKVEKDEELRRQIGQHMTSWQFSQFLHGEQGAMICSARIVESVPGIEAKFYAATQTMDEARHAETYSRFLQEKIGLLYPMNPHLKTLLDQTLSDSRWDMPYLGMQVLIEGLALAAFGYLRDLTGGGRSPLAHQILSYVMQDEARHVAFGRMALKEYYSQLSAKELDEREEFVVEGCYLMRDRLQAREVWENLGFDVDECMEYVENSPLMRMFRAQLFNRIVPCVKDIGLWGDRVQKAYADMGVLDMAGNDLDALMRNDEDLAEALDRDKRELSARAGQVAETIAVGASA
ncbi:MAG TPA: ferritin-like domain-containing protein [Mycobacteriales bacterium]|nr:ferritin-like domain-containing protein [Mycobacteriales bacterium]